MSIQVAAYVARREPARPGTGEQMAQIYARKTRHADRRTKRRRTRQASTQAALRDWR